MPYYFQIKAGRAAEISFKREGFFLMVPAAHQPVYGESSRTELYGYPGIFKPARRKMQPRLHSRTSDPARLKNTALAGAGCLHPAQSRGSFFSIVAGKHEVPQCQDGN